MPAVRKGERGSSALDELAANWSGFGAYAGECSFMGAWTSAPNLPSLP
jgi:hypothetical protein